MWFRSFLASWKPVPYRNQRPSRRSTRLVLEHLEDRTLPSSYTAASVSELVADITAANTAGGANTITLTAPTTSPYALTAANNLNGGAVNGLPVIAANDNLTIVGNGDTIERTNGQAGAPYRLLDVGANGALTLQNLTLQGGLVEVLPGYGGGASGGAIYNAGTLTLSGVTVANNQAYAHIAGPAGGGGIWSDGSLTLENGTLLEGNIARGTAAYVPYNTGEWNGGLSSPAGPAFGGAVYVAGGTATITNTTFTDNSAIGGAGAEGLASGDAFGGALYVAAGQVILTNATVNNNFAYIDDFGGLPPATGYEGGGLYIAGGTVTLANDTVQSNAVAYGFFNIPIVDGVDLDVVYGGYGGGMYVAPVASVSLDAFTLANTIDNSDSSGTNGSTANIDFAPFPPTVVNAASASPSSVTGTTTNLSVLGNDPAGASALTYTWAVTSAPAGAATPTFSSNGSNAAQDTTATFYLAGSYTFQVTLTDPSDLTAVSSVSVIVNQTLTSVSVAPGTVALAVKSQQQFQAVTLDQFAQPMAAQPSSFTWSIAAGGIGSINSSGAYTAPNSGTGSATIQATTSGITGTATVTVKPFPPVITAPASAKQTTVTGTQTQLQVQASDPQGAKLSYAWSVASQPPGAAAPTFSNANSTNTTVTFHEAGSYTFTVTVTDALGLVSTSSVTVTVTQTVTSLSVTPAAVTLAPGATEQFTATALDQFGQALVVQPAFTWQVNGGTISSTGLYTAPKSGTGKYQVKVSADGLNAQVNVTVT